MARIAFYHEIKDEKRDEYREIHADVPSNLEQAYLESGAGLTVFSLFEKDGFVFGFLEVDDSEKIKAVMEDGEAQKEWQKETLPLLEKLPEDIWMDELYRLR